ncbi:MAG TPA: hypothetical protein VEA38_18250 [Terriglobales bacterium]|nr:hypothetical protein [Terriglobales bacterium]
MSTTPTPRRLYVHDDLTEAAWSAPRRLAAVRLAAALFTRVRREPHAVVLTLAEQLDAVLARGGRPPFAAAVGIGAAGARVAQDLHARAGWFPTILRVDVSRVEDGRGGYALTGPAPLAAQLAAVPDSGPVAVVDDTLFSGLTLRAVLGALPASARRRAHVFCLRAVAESVPAIQRLCPVTIGFAAPGRILEDVSFINASGLVRRGAIRRAGAPPLAFFERPEWMSAWFPSGAAEIIRVCRRLHALLDVPAGASLGAARAV